MVIHDCVYIYVYTYKHAHTHTHKKKAAYSYTSVKSGSGAWWTRKKPSKRMRPNRHWLVTFFCLHLSETVGLNGSAIVCVCVRERERERERKRERERECCVCVFVCSLRVTGLWHEDFVGSDNTLSELLLCADDSSRCKPHYFLQHHSKLYRSLLAVIEPLHVILLCKRDISIWFLRQVPRAWHGVRLWRRL